MPPSTRPMIISCGSSYYPTLKWHADCQFADRQRLIYLVLEACNPMRSSASLVRASRAEHGPDQSGFLDEGKRTASRRGRLVV